MTVVGWLAGAVRWLAVGPFISNRRCVLYRDHLWPSTHSSGFTQFYIVLNCEYIAILELDFVWNNLKLEMPVQPRAKIPGKEAAKEPSPPKELEAAALFETGREVVLVHNGERYRLRITTNGKLILTK